MLRNIVSITSNKEATIKLNLSIATRPVTLLLDSGSSVSLINSKLIKNGTLIDRRKAIRLTSATGHSASTIASALSKISMNNIEREHEFHLYDNSLPIPFDGILGSDFLTKFKCSLDFDTHTLKFGVKNSSTSDMPHQPHALLHSSNSFSFPHKAFPNAIHINEANDNSTYNYLHDTQNCNFNHDMLIPEYTLKCIRIHVNLLDGQYFFNTNNFMHPVDIANSMINIANQTAFILIENRNKIPIVLNDTIFNKNKFTRADKFHILQLKIASCENRKKFILTNLHTGQCNDEVKKPIEDLCCEFNDCFYVEGDQITHTDIVKHSIQLKPDAKPVFTRQYKLPEAQKAEIQRQLNKMESENIIEKCSANGWNSPLILVPKRDENGNKNQFRLVVDFRRLNEATIPIQFPIPSIDSILDRLAGSKIFTTLDLYGAFYQIQLDENSRSFTTFENNNFAYRFRSMPQGLNSSPATMQNAVNTLFYDLLNNGVNIYFDDIVLYSSDTPSHMVLLRDVLLRLRKHKFKLKIEKCNFFCEQVAYLGHIINGNGSTPNPEKVKCIQSYPVPCSVADTQRFLGMCNYFRKYISEYAHTARPLYNLLKKDHDFIWTPLCQNAFETLKKALISPPILIFPDFKESFIITTDASDIAVGAVLSQGKVPNDRPIQFASKVLNAAQKKYSTIEKELLGIVFGITTYRHYVYGVPFILIVDHKPLVYLFNIKDPNSRLYRMRHLISEYNFKIIYRPGKLNTVADALSRISYEAHDPADLGIVLTLTRSAAQQVQKPDTDIEYRKNNHNFYEIVEMNDLLTHSDTLDQIFYIFSSADCEMKRKLEYRLKTSIKLPTNFLPTTPYPIDGTKTIFLFPNFKIDDERIIQTKLLLNTIHDKCIDLGYVDIAINIDIKEPKRYFEFKFIFKEIFKRSSIHTKFYLNKIMDVFEINDIVDILNTYHNSSLAGHTSFEKTKNAISRYYRWPTMNADIKNFVKNCEICSASKISRHTKSPMMITSTSDHPFQKVYVDFVNVERQHVSEYPCIFTCIDELTKFGIAVRAKNCTSQLAAKKFVKHVILKHNIPESVVSDQASVFLHDMFKEITKLFKIKKITTTPYRPNANIVERFHRTLAQHLITCVHENPQNWHEHLDSAVFAYNNTINSATGFTPHELIFGYTIQLPDKIIKNSAPIYNYDNYREDLRHTLKKYWNIAKENIDKRKHLNKEQRDKNCNPLTVNVGDRVLLKKPFKKHKYATPYDGPFLVEEILSPVTVKIKKGNKSVKIHTDKLKSC